MNAVRDYLEALAGPFLELRGLDVLDILLVAGLLYGATAWVRRSRGTTAAVGLFSLVLFYAAARAVGLQLLTSIFELFLAFFALLFVVLFQDDLRQLFERVGLWGLRRRAAVRVSTATSEVLTTCLTAFARSRTGALIVIPGRQPLMRHVRGGIELNGRVSVPLLESIFDASSPGHDGAVIIEGDRVTRFAVHLPLSENFATLRGAGTRHSAALGLSERCDAWCLVASEERGQISVARDGELRRLADPAALAGILGEIDARQDADQPTGIAARLAALWRGIRWRDLALSVVATLFVWLALVPGVRPTEVTMTLPVTLTSLSPQFQVESIEPAEVEVTLAAPARSFYFFNESSVEIVVDATLADLGRRTFRLGEEQIRHPPGMEIANVEPDRVRLSLKTEAAAKP